MLLLPRERVWLLLDIYVALTELKHKMSFFVNKSVLQPPLALRLLWIVCGLMNWVRFSTSLMLLGSKGYSSSWEREVSPNPAFYWTWSIFLSVLFTFENILSELDKKNDVHFCWAPSSEKELFSSKERILYQKDLALTLIFSYLGNL